LPARWPVSATRIRAVSSLACRRPFAGSYSIYVGVAVVGLLGLGCSEDGEPGGTTTGATGSGGAGGIGMTTTGGAGGSGGVAGGGGAGGDRGLNVCECLAGRNATDPETPNAPACAACFADRVDTGSCVNAGQACLADPACKAIFDCLQGTAYTEAEILACLPKEDSPDPSHQTFFDAVTCICESCTVCESAGPIACNLGGGPPHCGCILRTYQAGPCETCSAGATASSCAGQKAACDADAGCASILACLPTCSDGDCVDACFGETGGSFSLAAAYFDCTCSACASDCGTRQTCD
jgi:hypothetical protein